MFYLVYFLLFIKFVVSIDTVKELDLEKYQGKWYQMYSNRFVQTFEKYGKCIIADYSIISDGNIIILNSLQSLSNKSEQISGYAYYKNNINSKFKPGELTVHLDGVLFDSPYWIIELGPIIDQYYDWAFVSDPLKLSLFILARDINRFYKDYDSDVLKLIESYGFKNIIKTSQENCSYI
jgi:lipocalin